MDYKRTLQDVAIARKAIADSQLDVVTSSQRLLCEVYCLTSFSNQTFFLQVYEGEQYILLFVKPYLHTPLGISSVSVPFSTIVESEKHIAYRGDIYCSIKHVSKKDVTINTLKACLPTANEIVKEPGITIDGITTLVINHIPNEPVTLYFRNEAEFTNNTYTSENAQFLHNLYAHIEAIIGNLRRSSR